MNIKGKEDGSAAGRTRQAGQRFLSKWRIRSCEYPREAPAFPPVPSATGLSTGKHRHPRQVITEGPDGRNRSTYYRAVAVTSETIALNRNCWQVTIPASSCKNRVTALPLPCL